MENMTEVLGDLWNLTNATEATNYTNSTVTSKIPTSTYKFKPDRYIAEEGKMENYLEYKIAWGIDSYYVPICSALGIIGNTISFLVLILSKSTTTYQYMAAISCTDTLVLILNIMFLVRKFPGHEIFYTGTCGLIFFLFYFAIHLNVILMVTMTVERYAAIRFPLKASGWFTVRRARVAILIEIFIVFTLNLHHFFTREMVEVDGGNSSSCSRVSEMNTFFLTRIWPWIDAVWYCYFPLACICVLNILIICHIRRSGRIQRQMSQSTKKNGKERQITIMLLLVTFCFLIFVGPIAMIIIIERYAWLRVTAQEHALFYLVRTILNNLMYTNHALNFLLYFMSGQRFRTQVKETLCICRRAALGSTVRNPAAKVAGNTGSILSVATLSSDVSKGVTGSQLSVNTT